MNDKSSQSPTTKMVRDEQKWILVFNTNPESGRQGDSGKVCFMKTYFS
jgi:hypothetical protein